MSDQCPKIDIAVDQCKGCELCMKHCPKQLIGLSSSFNKLGYRHAVVNEEGCTGCASCYYSCPEPGTITVLKPKKRKSGHEERADERK